MTPNCRRFFKERICFNDFFSLGSIRCNDGRHNFLPLAHRHARVIGTDALRILVISQEASGGEEGNQDNEDNPNIDAHQNSCRRRFWLAEKGRMNSVVTDSHTTARSLARKKRYDATRGVGLVLSMRNLGFSPPGRYRRGRAYQTSVPGRRILWPRYQRRRRSLALG